MHILFSEWITTLIHKGEQSILMVQQIVMLAQSSSSPMESKSAGKEIVFG